jgi:superfamily I DNA/RNA helicase
LAHKTAELNEAARRRAETGDALVESDAESRLIIAGPGTGKTYNFRRALEAVGGNGLALTFIRALVRDLDRDLGDLAQVNTFHGYCKHLAYKLPLDGLAKGLDYYPPLLLVVAEDMKLLGHDVQERDLQGALHNLDDDEGLITGVLDQGSYYNAVSHADVVYRVLRHLENNPGAVPEFPLVVVDEYQDFCLMETEFIDVLRTASPVLVAGDDDQALYAFKDSSPDFVRALADDDAFERFDLPYCSRCTKVIVDAVNNVVEEAQREGNLADRVDREYLCYLPDKLADSEAHPSIIWAECSVQTKRAPYIGRYVAEQIGLIPEEDIAESHEGRYPTALVIGRRHFVEAAYAVISETFPHAVLRSSAGLTIDALDGYRRLAVDADSQLGWRIIIHASPFSGADEALTEALGSQTPLTEILPEDYREEHLAIAEIIRQQFEGGITEDQIAELERGLDRPFEEIEAALERDEEGEPETEPDPEDGVPTIVCTSLLGAKGLSAGYVFIVGFNNGLFPSDPNAVTDDEVCKLIVGLSRTRKECHLVSCGFYATRAYLEPSVFLDWLGVDVEKRSINKDYWA